MTFRCHEVSPLAPIVTSFPPSRKPNRYSGSSSFSHASSSSWTPSRDSICSNNSDWSTTLITPKVEKTFNMSSINDESKGEAENQVEYIELAGRESWWTAIGTRSTLQGEDQDDRENEAIDNHCLDDSPTLPSTSKLPEIATMPAISLGRPLSSKRMGKMPARPGTPFDDKLGSGMSMTGRSIFDVSVLDSEDRQDVFASVPIRRPFTKRRPPIPTFPSEPVGPSIPARASSRKRPVLPQRDSSLKSLSAHLKTESQICIPSRSTHPHRPIPIRTFSHPPSCSSQRSSLRSQRRISPALLQPISETPKDLDVPPDGSWALRRPYCRLGLAKSQPNLRSQGVNMTIKFKLRRSNSSETNQDGSSDFMPLDAFPSSRDSFDGSDRLRESRASFSDMARTFMPRAALPESPSRMSLDGRPTTNFGSIPKKSTKLSSNLLGGLKKSHSVRRPSLLGLPEWSSKSSPTSRSISDSCVVQLSPTTSKTLEALSLSHGSYSPAPSSYSGSSREEVLRVKYNHSRHSIASSSFSRYNSHMEEDLLAVLEAQHWDWPSPPFRIERSESTPGLSTSGTLDSMVSPQTPSESEFVLHGEAEFLARATKEKKGEEKEDQETGPLSLGDSIESLNIHL
ncbi:uncharacterized protein I303_106633 [Kwoniella dejecticola CBS 10117]|uniref:Uncharacterized protein n=1 Tax=Kwoniella dejecticola CBS 10117 TaxID=1296121 RepID=A0A1A5ZU47_9TREE|nr:uncharacterized protein I303_08107 [Kwoniella dejecticola CBS 10117]OBR81337.1 hypothetical protein I303_08107 [Kwoniella dejecticola CBS 10117]